jgi:hypothetical protein
LLRPLENQAITFMNGLNDLSEDRNLMAHCLWEFFRPEPPLAMDVLNIKAVSGTPDGISFQRTSISVEQLKNVTTIASDLNVRLLPISKGLVELCGRPPSEAQIF